MRMKKNVNQQISVLLLFFISVCNINAQDKNPKIAMIQKDIKTEEGLKAYIMRLIDPEKDFGREDLDLLYHDDMSVIILDDKSTKNQFNKTEFVVMIGAKLDNHEEHKNNNWAKFHHIEVDGNKGYVIVERKLNLIGSKTKLLVSLDFVWEDERWQIIRENIYSQALD